MTAAEREEAYLEAMEEHIWIRQNTVAQFIATQSIMYLCEDTEITPGVQVGMLWWEQADIELVGARDRAVVAADADGNEDGR